ncbi:MAG: hypothetical protein QT10_C0008G0025 [archaeon GW2011_AR19]|nr:MAG: hypothetical protein QT10_C0008G0025 [archaeon GW2011_AR19]
MKKLAIIFGLFLLMSVAFVSAHYNSENDLDKNGKVSFSEWIKNIFGKITGKALDQPQQGPLPLCLDSDGDGYNSTIGDACGRVVDCNDLNKLIYPGAPENTTALCSDNLDNDCDFGKDCADSNCNLKLSTGGKTCQYGTETTCNDVFDNDADGKIDCADSDCSSSSSSSCVQVGCVNGATQICGTTDAGECNKGVQTCSSGQWSACGGAYVGPATEICGNNIDEDCNGVDLVCPITACTDTDAGINYTIAGSAYNLTFLNSPKQDYCINNTHLNESSCSVNNAVISQPYNCKLLGAAYSCSQGACSCNPTYVKSSCANEIAVFEDASACGASDYTAPYDCDGNGVISKPSCISTTADVSIGEGMEFLPFDNSINYSGAGSQIVQVAEGYQGVEFDWNFSASEKLDFCDIEIKTSSPTNNFGYVLFNSTQNISNKIVYVDKLNSSSGAVCIKDVSGVVSVSEFSSNCSASNEVLLICPSPRDDSGEPSPTNSIYNCDISEDNLTFIVWPLNHSAVKEMLSITGLVSDGTGCFENWNCTEWSDAVNQCGTKTCNDLNNCGTNLSRPLEIKSCVLIGETEGDEFETGTSESRESNTKSVLFIILGIVGLILIIFLILHFMKRGKSEEEFSEPPAHHQQTPPPRSLPAPPQNRAVHHNQYQHTQLAPQR